MILGLAACDPTDHVRYAPLPQPVAQAPGGGTGGGGGTQPGGGGTTPTPTAACTDTSGCQTWETCSSTTHTCQLQAGSCGTDADCGLGTCGGAHTCAFTPGLPGDVLLLGTLGRGDAGALSRLDTPAIVSVGLASSVVGGVIDPAGDFVYLKHDIFSADDFRRFVPDSLTRDARVGTDYPVDQNDPILAHVSCPNADTNDVIEWTMQAGTGKLLYGCANNSQPELDFYDETNTLQLSTLNLFAWTSGGYMLTGSSNSNSLQVRSPAGVLTDVTGFFEPNSAVPPPGFVYRTHGDAFWMAIPLTTLGSAPERWSIDSTGVATKEGSYADLPANITVGRGGGGVIDATGALYQAASDTTTGTSVGVIVKRPLAPDTSTVVYTQGDKPAGANDFSVFPMKTFNMGLRLVTEP